MPERIPIGADHAGFEMKAVLAEELRRLGFDVEDVGSHSTQPSDYADYAHAVAREIEEGMVHRGVLLCGSGLGMSYAANRHPGVRAAVVWDNEIARLSRQHNDANVLVLPSRCMDDDTAVESLHTWLNPTLETSRNIKRIDKIKKPT